MSHTMDDEMKETPKDEAKESPEKQQKEESEGTEAVKIPEEFQKKVYELMQECDTERMCSYVRDCCYECEKKIREKESKGKKGKKAPGPVETFSSEGEPY